MKVMLINRGRDASNSLVFKVNNLKKFSFHKEPRFDLTKAAARKVNR